MKSKRIVKSEIFGLVFSVILSVILHEVFKFTAGARIAAVFGGVNESVWEHLKILSFAYLLWIPFGLFISKIEFKRYLVAKTFGVVFIILSVTFFFYIYSGILGKSLLWVDILTAVVCTALAYFISARLCLYLRNPDKYFWVCVFLLILIITAFLCFTPNPPRIGLFRDPSGSYGIPSV
ncbi:MAG: hypothetical protein IJL87_05755 [Clostridia bacterium]|nr:hypothetical protein [Clostridia bacterium]